MSSTPKKRTKVKRNPNSDVGSGVDSSVSSSSLLLKSMKEPPRDFFPSKDDLAALITVLIIASLVFVSCNFFVSRLSSRHPVPFCDTDADSLDLLSDVCEPCPRHGECRDGKLECLHGYRKHGRLCIEDGVINEAVNKLVKENDIWDDLDGKELVESIGSDNTTLMYAKSKALETIGGLLQTRQNSFGIKELKCPDLLAESYKPFTCRIRHWVLQHAFVVLPVFLLLVGCTWLLWKLYRRQNLTNRAEDLYNQVCEILEENALTSTRNSDQCESWVVASRLRDHLLLPRERKNPLLWKKVEELVQEDSRIDRYPRLVKGDGKEVWEWQEEFEKKDDKVIYNRTLLPKIRSPACDLSWAPFSSSLWQTTLLCRRAGPIQTCLHVPPGHLIQWLFTLLSLLFFTNKNYDSFPTIIYKN